VKLELNPTTFGECPQLVSFASLIASRGKKVVMNLLNIMLIPRHLRGGILYELFKSGRDLTNLYVSI
jgi:hypothetical protein